MASTSSASSSSEAVLDFVTGFDACTLSHRGVLLDLGDATMRARMAAGRFNTPDVEVREREGATWASLRGRTYELSFVSAAEPNVDAGVVIEARVRGGIAKGLSVYLNGKAMGVLGLKKGEANVVSLRASNATIARGANDLLLRVIGGPRASQDSLAEIDWIRVGPADGDAPYAAPTRSDALTTVSIGGVARRGISLHAPGSIRCTGAIPNETMLEGYVGVIGGEAEGEVRVLTDRAEPRIVGSFKLGGEGTPPWQPLSLPLGTIGTLASVELVAKSSTKGARIVFAEPRVTRARRAPVEQRPVSRGVIVVVLGTVSPNSLALYGGKTATTELAQLASGGTIFNAHRATTSFANGVVGSMITGLSPREHGVFEPEASFGAGTLTIAEAARQAGIATAMFTANPTTSEAFGFQRGWETFTARPVTSEAPATALFDDVEKWLEEHKDARFMVFVHARGGHPPWDVTADELKELAPAGYAGSLEPKHAGEVLAKVRKNGTSRLFTDADRERAFALHDTSVAAHDAALGRLIARVKAMGRESDTTWIVTGDVGVDAAAPAPFLEDDTLDESALAVPLVVRGPGSARERVSAPTASIDLARTALEALGLKPPPQLRGESLWPLVHRGAQDPERPRVATTASRFSARWSGFVLSGTRLREGKLCNLALEPSCVSDIRATHPIAAEIMHAWVFDELGATWAGPPAPRAHGTPNEPTTAALRAWGVIGGKTSGK